MDNGSSRAIQYSSHTFQYQLLPSAFQIAECPTYLCWKAMKHADALWNRDEATSGELLKNRTIAVLAGLGGYIGGMCAVPFTLCCTPVTLLADLVIGACEYAYCLKKGLLQADLDIIKHRKFFVSPCQHLTFCLGAIASLGIIWIPVLARMSPFIPTIGLKAAWMEGFKVSLIFWTIGYAFGQVAVGQLPQSFNHHSFNIFIGGGSGEESDEHSKWLNSILKTQI